MSVEIVIDPNVRVEGGRTYAGFEDVVGGFVGDLRPDMPVTVAEEEADLIGEATIHSIDRDRQLIYLTVEWSSLRPRPTDSQIAHRREWSPLVKALLVTRGGEQPLAASGIVTSAPRGELVDAGR